MGAEGRDDREFESFFESIWPRAKAVGTRMGMTPDEAEDVALDALAIAYDRWHRVRGLSYRDAWTLKVAANLGLRRIKRRRPSPQLAARPTSSSEDQVVARLATGAALAQLPKRQQQVMVLRYIVDLPEAEVAQLLGIDAGSVKQHASRGRLSLKANMAPLEGGEDRGR